MNMTDKQLAVDTTDDDRNALDCDSSVAFRRAWDACTKTDRARFLRELRAERTAAKRERRAARELELAEKTRKENKRRGHVEIEPPPDGWPYIVEWLEGLPVWQIPGDRWARWGLDLPTTPAGWRYLPTKTTERT
jgi:hypothetical protein